MSCNTEAMLGKERRFHLQVFTDFFARSAVTDHNELWWGDVWWGTQVEISIWSGCCLTWLSAARSNSDGWGVLRSWSVLLPAVTEGLQAGEDLFWQGDKQSAVTTGALTQGRPFLVFEWILIRSVCHHFHRWGVVFQNDYIIKKESLFSIQDWWAAVNIQNLIPSASTTSAKFRVTSILGVKLASSFGTLKVNTFRVLQLIFDSPGLFVTYFFTTAAIVHIMYPYNSGCIGHYN